MKVAQYKTKYGSLSVWEVDEWIEKQPDYVRVSEPVEVDFVPRPNEEIIPAQIAALDAEKEEITAEFQKSLNSIAQRRANLLALTQSTEAA